MPGLCNTCPFWDLLHNSQVTEGGPIVQSGLCRKDAPQHIDLDPDRSEDAQPLPPTIISGIRPGMFPTTRGNDWCGRHPLRVALYDLDVDSFRLELKERRRAIEKAQRRAPPNPPGGGSSGSRQ